MDSRPSENPGIGSDSSAPSPRLIGKRLYIDGYIYTSRSYYVTSVAWDCRRSRLPTNKCPAKATTSNPSNGGKLIVKKGPEKFKHNHQPFDKDVKEAEMYAEFGMNMKTQIILHRVQTPVKTHVPEGTQPTPRTKNLKRSIIQEAEEPECSTRLRKMRKVFDAKQYCTTKRRSPLSNPDMYRIFLANFMMNPVFDRKNVIEALRSIYKSDVGCSMNYSTILENQKKIEQDLEALKNDLNVALVPLIVVKYVPTYTQEKKNPKNTGRENGKMMDPKPVPIGINSTAVQRVSVSREENSRDGVGNSCRVETEVTGIAQSQEQESHDVENFDEEMIVEENSGGAPPPPPAAVLPDPVSMIPSFQATAGPPPQPIENQNHSRPPMATLTLNENDSATEEEIEDSSSFREETDRDISETIPPVPGAIPIVDLLHSQSVLSTMNYNDDEPEVEKEIALIDLTNDPDGKQECVNDEIPQEVQEATHSVPSVLETNTRQTSEPTRLNHAFVGNPTNPEPQFQPHSQYMFPNLQGNWFDPNINRLFNCIPDNLNLNAPYLIGDVQVPLLMNLPSVRSDGTSTMDHLFAQIQVFRQTASFPQFQGSKS